MTVWRTIKIKDASSIIRPRLRETEARRERNRFIFRNRKKKRSKYLSAWACVCVYTFESSARNDEGVVDVNQTVPLGIVPDVCGHAPGQSFPDLVEVGCPLAIAWIPDTLQYSRLWIPVGQCHVQQLVRLKEVRIHEFLHLLLARIVARGIHQSLEAASAQFLLFIHPSIEQHSSLEYIIISTRKERYS